MDINFAKLQQKDVIDISKGKRIGRIGDVVFDEEEHKVKSFVIFGESRVFGLKKSEDIVFDSSAICQIGEDVILVDIKSEESSENTELQHSNFIYSPKVFRKRGKE